MDWDMLQYWGGGYQGDIKKTFNVGNVYDNVWELVRTAFDCLLVSLSMVKLGIIYRNLGKAIHKT